MPNTIVALLLLLPALASALSVPRSDAINEGQVIRASANDDDPVPKWYSQFNIEFNETSIILFRRQTAGKWWYDADAGQEVITREDGRGDRYCGSIHPRTVTPCTHLVTDGKRYLVFPEIKECCLCCLDSQGCGAVSSNWLDGASFEGNQTKNGLDVFAFRKDGVQSNYYYTTADEDQKPVELDMWPNLYQDLHTDTFVSGQGIPSDLLEVPENCAPRCPLTSLCTAVGKRRSSRKL
eukprot:gene2414-8728_t